jgi:hypothetical protein
VRGRVIDFWGQPVADVPVMIDATQVVTNDQGEFEIDDVAAEYNVSLLVRYSDIRKFGWYFDGLTRRDPTLQVYSGRDVRYGNFALTTSNLTLDNEDTFSFSLASPHGFDLFEDRSAGGLQSSTNWNGPQATPASAHGLVWQLDPDTDLPIGYSAYTQLDVMLSDTVPAMIPLELGPSVIASAAVAGVVMPADDAARGNAVFVRFSSGAGIRVVDDRPGPNTFSYLAPTLPSSSITIAAYEGSWSFGEFSLVHANGVAPGTDNVALTIPQPATPLLPASGAADVTVGTKFRWLPGSGNPGPYVVQIESENYYEGIFVVTEATEFDLPSIVDGAFAFRPSDTIFWRVETHGPRGSVDAMAGPSGFLDPFSFTTTEPMGPRDASGSYTASYSHLFTAE